MDLKELDSFKMSDAIAFHDQLNPKLFRGNHLQSDVSEQLKVIAQDFLQELGIKDLDVRDITISGSNAAYSYTPNSDLDLHILVDLSQYPDDEIYQELFHAKKTIYNDSHNIKVHGIPVELYVQDANQPVISLGEYSLLKDKWLRIPTKRRSNFDQTATKQKYEKLLKIAEYALQSKKLSKVKQVLQTIKRYRQAGLDKGGEFGPENLAYKALRSQGIITKLYDLRDKLHSKQLSLNSMYSDVDEDYNPNGVPPGPEFKPTMPAGTVRVDVSDVYDWYKLGQHISDLGHTDPSIFGKGPPSTIMAFGSEPEEHKYINNLKNIGLDTTDIDPVDPNQPKNMPRQKTDPTYNVNEEDLDESLGAGPYQVGDVLFDIRRHAIERLEERNVPITTAKEMLRRISTMKHKLRNMQPHAAFWVYDESLGISMGMRVLDSGKVQWATTIIGKPYGRIDNPIIDLTESTQEIQNYSKLDKILHKLCGMIIKGQEKDSEYYGMVAAAVLDPDNNIVAGVNRYGSNGKRVHAERVAIEKYEQKYGTVPEGIIVITTLSPCNESDDETAAGRVGESCTDYLNSKGIEKVYCGYIDPTQDNDQRQFNILETSNQDIRKECKSFADTFLKKDVNEAFDKPYSFKWETSEHGDYDALAKLPDGTNLSIMFTNQGDEEWQVEFHRNNSQEVTGEGDSQRVFATVLSAIDTFIKKEHPWRIMFSASKDVEPGQNSESRAKLYDRLIKRYAKAWGYEEYNEDHGDQVTYELTRLKQNVAEARTNPDQNVKAESGMKELEAVAKTISDPENWAVSMTSEPKLGINPQVGISEDTPKGIYFYPLNYVLGKIHSRKPLPWGDNYPYIQLFQYDRSNQMTQQTTVDSAKLKQALSQYCSDEIIQQALDEPEYDGTLYWTIYDCLSRLGKSDETNVVRWNKVLRDLGFTSVFDPGNGWIAHNEPTQGVVLDPRIIKQHKTILNRKESNVVTPALIEKLLFDEIDMELANSRIWQKYDPDGSKLRRAVKKYATDPKFKPDIGKTYNQELEDKIKGYRLYGARQLSDVAMAWYKAQQPVNEASGYIPSEKEKNDPRFKTALTVDVKPDSIKKNAKAFAWLTNRAGVPPTANTNGSY